MPHGKNTLAGTHPAMVDKLPGVPVNCIRNTVYKHRLQVFHAGVITVTPDVSIGVQLLGKLLGSRYGQARAETPR